MKTSWVLLSVGSTEGGLPSIATFGKTTTCQLVPLKTTGDAQVDRLEWRRPPPVVGWISDEDHHLPLNIHTTTNCRSVLEGFGGPHASIGAQPGTPTKKLRASDGVNWVLGETAEQSRNSLLVATDLEVETCAKEDEGVKHGIGRGLIRKQDQRIAILRRHIRTRHSCSWGSK
jgi:hypothetical protein